MEPNRNTPEEIKAEEKTAEEKIPEEKTPEERLAILRQRARERRGATRAERDAYYRASSIAMRRRAIEGVDLVAVALSDPGSLTYPQRLALLGREPFDKDETAFLSKLLGSRDKPIGFSTSYASSPASSLISADIC